MSEKKEHELEMGTKKGIPQGLLLEKAKESKIGGAGLIQAIVETIENINEMLNADDKDLKVLDLDSPMSLLEDEDLNDSDPVVKDFINDGGCKGVVKIMRFVKPEDGTEVIEKLSSLVYRLNSIRTANRNNLLRQIFAAIQTARGVDNDAVRFERIASKMPTGSRGYFQAEAVSAIDYLLSDTLNAQEKRTLLAAKNGTLEGTNETMDAAAFRLRSIFASTVPEDKSVRVAYTTLRTQFGEPYLLCPKGKYTLGHAVPMETSKCRENCIDSRVASDGSVSCQYQAWLKSADTHEKAMARLDVQRHPDNELNLLNIAEGKRARPMTETDVPLEKLFEDSKQGANKERDKKPADVNIETQLDKAKAGKPGYRNDNGVALSEINSKLASYNFKKNVVAQNASDKTLEEQMPKGVVRDDVLEKQLRDTADNAENEKHETVREQQLVETTSLNGHRGEMETSYAEQLNVDRAVGDSVTESLNNQEEIDGVRVTEELNRTAAKVDKLDSESDDTLGTQLEAKHDDVVGDENIELLLEDERVGLNEDEIDMLLEELLERERNAK